MAYINPWGPDGAGGLGTYNANMRQQEQDQINNKSKQQEQLIRQLQIDEMNRSTDLRNQYDTGLRALADREVEDTPSRAQQMMGDETPVTRKLNPMELAAESGALRRSLDPSGMNKLPASPNEDITAQVTAQFPQAIKAARIIGQQALRMYSFSAEPW